MSATPVVIQMDSRDFDYLATTSMNWALGDWQTQDGRFDPLPDYRKFARIYWFASYADLILARSFLTSSGFESATHFDEVESQDSFVLLTDFGGAL